jgi:hypothetical protein
MRPSEAQISILEHLTPDCSERAALERGEQSLREAERALARASRAPDPGQEREWVAEVTPALETAQRAIRLHREAMEGPRGLYEELQHEAQWLVPRLERLLARLGHIEAETDGLRRILAGASDEPAASPAAIRADAQRMLRALRALASREGDLLFDRFNEPSAGD